MLSAGLQVGLAFVRRGWAETLLRLGAMEDAAFVEPEMAFCLHGLATGSGVMEAVCRIQVRREEELFTLLLSSWKDGASVCLYI